MVYGMASFRALWLQYPVLPAVALILMACCVYVYLYGTNQRLDRFLVAVTLTVPCHVLAMLGAIGAAHIHPQKFDLYVYRIDKLSGFEPSFALGRIVLGHLYMIVLLAESYQLLPLAMVAIFGGYLWHRSQQEAMSMVRVFLLNLALSAPFYLLFPVCGPAYAFPGFPALPGGPVIPHPILLNAPPNGVPSIHFSTAVLVLWYGRKLPFGWWIGGIYLVLTAVSTLASGEHYLFDLLVAVPYAVMVYSLGNYIARLRVAFPTVANPVS
jgi:hypothetical protein